MKMMQKVTKRLKKIFFLSSAWNLNIHLKIIQKYKKFSQTKVSILKIKESRVMPLPPKIESWIYGNCS